MSIKQFFKDREIFITGGSGFMGKILIEKLMRSCPNIAKIYVLIRNKKGKNIQDRLETILNGSLFDRVRHEQPDAFKKIVAIYGDCMELGLGISSNDLENIKNVSIIFHCAASVRFDDKLRKAVIMNTRGTYELVKIAEKLNNLKVFVHTSTTYCNLEANAVEEMVYRTNADWCTTIKLAENCDADIFEILFPKYSDFKPNSYTFTKHLAEQIIDDYKDRLPVIIIRPSIVLSTLIEPVSGWVDNFNGPVGMLVASGVGILRTTLTKNVPLDVIPVDIAIRGMIIATYKKAKEIESCNNKKLDVYNATISNISPLTIYGIVEMAKEYIMQHPFEETVWVPGGFLTTCPIIHYFRLITIQLMMAIVIDFIFRIIGRKPFILKLQRSMNAALSAVVSILRDVGKFENNNFLALNSLVTTQDYDDFEFLSHTSINYHDYMAKTIVKVKVILMHEESADSSAGAKLRLTIFKITNLFLRFLRALLFIWVIFKYILPRIL